MAFANGIVFLIYQWICYLVEKIARFVLCVDSLFCNFAKLIYQLQ